MSQSNDNIDYLLSVCVPLCPLSGFTVLLPCQYQLRLLVV